MKTPAALQERIEKYSTKLQTATSVRTIPDGYFRMKSRNIDRHSAILLYDYRLNIMTAVYCI